MARQLTEAVRFLSGREGDTSVAIGDRDLDGILDGDDNCPGIANAAQLDSDGNGVGDLCEPLADNDQDGYPFSLDADDSNARRLPVQGGATGSTSYFVSSTRLSLGRYARELSRQSNFTRAAVAMSDSDFLRVAGVLDSGIVHSVDLATNSIIGIVSLDIEAQSGSAGARLQLVSKLPLNPVFRVYDTSTGLWSDFAVDAQNILSSALALQGECPAADSSNYGQGLRAGDTCVLLVIQDGGSNDSDNASNGTVALLGNPGERTLGESGGRDPVNLNPSKGGGSLAPLSLRLMGLICVWRRGRQRGFPRAR